MNYPFLVPPPRDPDRDSKPSVSTFYTRTLKEDGRLIESVCTQCGFVILGSVREGLPEIEAEHMVECLGKKQPGSAH